MTEYDAFYQGSLYPLQDGVLQLVSKLKLPLYLTGGTALSRFYCHHRYSDDIDLFVNNDEDFPRYVEQLLNELFENSNELNVTVVQELIRKEERFAQFFIRSKVNTSCILKIDIVNDVPFRAGSPIISEQNVLIDTWENILSNKICAMYRYEIKDIVDIEALSRRYPFDWAQIIKDAKRKEGGIDPLMASEILQDVPIDQYSIVKWIGKPDISQISANVKLIAIDFFNGSVNSLCLSSMENAQ